MNWLHGTAALILLSGASALAQPSAAPADSGAPMTTVRGCLQGERGNYLVVADTGMVYVLKGVGNKLDSQLNHQVEAKGELLPGTVKSGTRPEKAGSNPSDTTHGVDGATLQIGHLPEDVRTIAKRCKAGDQR
jgi:hypothetical protein